jgi:hypothetical protein
MQTLPMKGSQLDGWLHWLVDGCPVMQDIIYRRRDSPSILPQTKSIIDGSWSHSQKMEVMMKKTRSSPDRRLRSNKRRDKSLSDAGVTRGESRTAR